MTIVSATTEVIETRRNLLNIRSMAMYECPINRYDIETSTLMNIKSSELIPGDIIEIPENCRMPCDCVLLEGTAVVNESMLTGESLPVIKNQIPENSSDLFDPEIDKKFTLYSGTEVIQLKPNLSKKQKTVYGLVIRTGFSTTKGTLVRYILYPKSVDGFTFSSDSYKFIAVMFIMSFIGMAMQLLSNSHDTETTIKKCLDLITITVPPALPACMSIGVSFALSRLKQKQVFCISPPRINVAGKINIFCFDKTGTLTEEGLSLYGYRVSTMNNEKEAVFCRLKNTVDDIRNSERAKFAKNHFINCLGLCHSIVNVNGKLVGDPLDLIMFNSTEFKICENDVYESPKDNKKLWIIQRFDFTSKLQRMSVISYDLVNNKKCVYCKGAPEKICELSVPESIPANFKQVLENYTKKGCRVIALAYKEIKEEIKQREFAEQKLRFLGLLVMQNKLKPVTKTVINNLQNANIKCIMITGDNPNTAISVGKECGIVKENQIIFLADFNNTRNTLDWVMFSNDIKNDLNSETKKSEELILNSESPINEYTLIDTPELRNKNIDTHIKELQKDLISYQGILKMLNLILDNKYPWENIDSYQEYCLCFTGKGFEYLMRNDKEKLTQIMQKSVVFARMLPDQKAELVEILEKQGNCVGMCGDGANDCVALKTAHVGISLSEAEASIAAPFTCKNPDITCVFDLLREGRAALSTSFQCFKYMALYSMIQFTSVSILYSLGKSLSDMQYLITDLLIIVPLAITMSRSGPAENLSIEMPISNLLSPVVIFSIVGEVVIQACFQVFFEEKVKIIDWNVFVFNEFGLV